MLTAVVPAHKEEYRISRVLDSLLAIAEISHIFVILNGSNELTQQQAQQAFAHYTNRITLIYFDLALGIDIPRAVGANVSFLAGADYTL